MRQFHEDIESARARAEAWWSGQILDRAAIQVTAPRKGARPYSGPDTDDLHRYFTDRELVCVTSSRAPFSGERPFP